MHETGIKPSRCFFYFLGNVHQHVLHAEPLLRRMGGQVVVLSEESKWYCEERGLAVLVVDEYPDGYENLDLSRVAGTIGLLDRPENVVFFFNSTNMPGALPQAATIFVPHGNALKLETSESIAATWKSCDRVVSGGPLFSDHLRANGVDGEKILPVGLPRNDLILKRVAGGGAKGRLLSDLGVKGEKKVVTCFTTWYGLTAVRFTARRILAGLADDFLVLFRPHPDTPTDVLDPLLKICDSRANVFYMPEGRYPGIDLVEMLAATDLFVLDYGSMVPDAILTARPLVFALDRLYLDTYRNRFRPSKKTLYRTIRNNVAPLLFFWKDMVSVRAGAYRPVGEIAAASPKIKQWGRGGPDDIVRKALADGVPPGPWRAVRERLFYSLDGRAMERIQEFAEALASGER